MASYDFYVDQARHVLAHVRLDHFIGDSGVPTDECVTRIEEGTLSSGEQVLVALSLAILDRAPFDPQVRVGALMRLDNANLRAVGEALIALADER